MTSKTVFAISPRKMIAAKVLATVMIAFSIYAIITPYFPSLKIEKEKTILLWIGTVSAVIWLIVWIISQQKIKTNLQIKLTSQFEEVHAYWQTRSTNVWAASIAVYNCILSYDQLSSPDSMPPTWHILLGVLSLLLWSMAYISRGWNEVAEGAKLQEDRYMAIFQSRIGVLWLIMSMGEEVKFYTIGRKLGMWEVTFSAENAKTRGFLFANTATTPEKKWFAF